MATNNFSGLDSLLKQLSTLDSKIQRTVELETLKAAEAIAKDAKELAPVLSGKLRDSIQVVRNETGLFSVGTNVPYAAAKELGIRNSVAKPFLFPAFMMNRDAFLENIKKAINSIT